MPDLRRGWRGHADNASLRCGGPHRGRERGLIDNDAEQRPLLRIAQCGVDRLAGLPARLGGREIGVEFGDFYDRHGILPD